MTAVQEDLMKLYSQRILALAAAIPHIGRLETPEGSAMKRSPLCGSTVTVDVRVEGGKYKVSCLTRGSVDTEKLDLANAIRCTFELIGAKVELHGDYPGWAPRPDSPIVKLMSGLYEELYGEKAPVLACHAGLECGIIGQNYPDMQMISFGPNIRGAHSPDEKVQISSVQKLSLIHI